MKDEDNELIRRALEGSTGAIAVAELDRVKVLTESEMFDKLLRHAERVIAEFGQMSPIFHAMSETNDYLCTLMTMDNHEQKMAGCFGLAQLFRKYKVTEYYFALEGWFWQATVEDDISNIKEITPEMIRDLKSKTKRECVAVSHIMYGGSHQIIYEIKRGDDGKVAGFEKMVDESFGIASDVIGDDAPAHFEGMFAELLP